MTVEQRETTPELCVGDLATDGGLAVTLDVVAGRAGLSRPIRHARVQKNGLALAGHVHGVVPTRVQILGETELSYFESLAPAARSEAARAYFALGLCCVVLTRARVPRELEQAAEASATPVLLSSGRTSATINAIHAVLDERLAPRVQLHGVLVDAFGIGLLLLGKSGIGKSECAVELVLRGHRLVADDVVRCEWHPPGMVFGAPAEVLRHHVEVRGLGILDIKQMFGVTAVRERKRIDLVVRLEEWSDTSDYDRLGVDDEHYTILGTAIRMLTIPVRPGRDMGSLLEMAARNELLRRAGHHSGRAFLARLEDRMSPAPELHSMESPESLVPGPVAASVPPPPNSSLAGGLDAIRGHDVSPSESSAWIPAVRPRERR